MEAKASRAASCSSISLLWAVLMLLLAVAHGREDAMNQGLPMYGNWCGPAHGSGVPIDDVDACCKTHDLCYDKNGYNYCDCDKGLVACLAQTSVPAGLQGSLQNPLQNSEKRVFKAAATSYFKNTFCKDASKEWRWARNFYVPLG